MKRKDRGNVKINMWLLRYLCGVCIGTLLGIGLNTLLFMVYILNFN